jgi:hypothetical protein
MIGEGMKLVIKKDKQYLDWSFGQTKMYFTHDPKRAFDYRNEIAFDDAEKYGGKVFLRFVSGREIEVSKEDILGL